MPENPGDASLQPAAPSSISLSLATFFSSPYGFSLYLTIALSLLRSLLRDHGPGSFVDEHAMAGTTQRSRRRGGQLRSLQEAATAAIAQAWEAQLPDAVPLPPAMVDGSSGLKQVQLNPVIVKVHSL